MDLKVPPHSQEAEQSVLGSILLLDDTDKAIPEIFDLLRFDMFYNRDHQIIFKAMTGLKVRDMVTISEKLEKDPDIDGHSIFVYLGELCKKTPSASNVISYVNIIRNKYFARQILNINHEASDRIYSGENNHVVAKSMLEGIRGVDDSGTYKPVHIKDHLSGWVDKMERRAKGQDLTIGHKTGISRLDTAIGGVGSDWLFVVAGRPSMGKTKIAQMIGGYMATIAPVQFFSMEMSEDETMDRVIGIGAGVCPKSIRTGLLSDYEWSRASNIMTLIETNKYNLYLDSEPGLTLAQIRQRVKACKKDNPNMGAFMIDYLELMEFDKAERHDLQIANVVIGLKKLAREVKVPCIFLAQANRGADDKRRATMSNLYGSSAIEKNADLVLFVHREEVANPRTKKTGITELVCAKFRHGDAPRDIYLKQKPDMDGGGFYCLTDEEIGFLEHEEDLDSDWN